jgi:tellurite methyltransferase
VRRRIVAFHQDDHGEWVAELDCFHAQHVRHRPPFLEREWVTTESGRAGRIGAELDCRLCDRAELPEGLAGSRTAGPFDEATVPNGLRTDHRVPHGTWGLLRVLDGTVGFRMETDPPIERRLKAGEGQPIPPDVPHRLRVTAPVHLQVEFLSPPEQLRHSR